MKVMAYNVSWCKQEKIDWLVSHEDVDAFIIPECGNEENIMIPKGFQFFWMGEYATKGLGVITRDGMKSELASWYNANLRYALPIIVEEKYLLLAIWPTKLTPSNIGRIQRQNHEISYHHYRRLQYHFKQERIRAYLRLDENSSSAFSSPPFQG